MMSAGAASSAGVLRIGIPAGAAGLRSSVWKVISMGGVCRAVRGALMAGVVLPAVTAGLVPSVSAAAPGGLAAVPGSFAVPGTLNGVAAVSASGAWAVGNTGVCDPKTLIARWDGGRWTRVPVPFGARSGELRGVAVTSAGNGWAVGYTGSLFSPDRSLMLRWNGTVWTRVVVPGAEGGVTLTGVAATSARHAWAVGVAGSGKVYIVGWDGHAWRRLHAPGPPGDTILTGVAATSVRNVWAVGYLLMHHLTGVILHWNGTAWTRTPVPRMRTGTVLGRVAATSADQAWAVGVTSDNKTLILRWNGTAWHRVTSPIISGGLTDVTVISARDAWAVGAPQSVFDVGCIGSLDRLLSAPGAPPQQTAGRYAASRVRPIILHWNGTTWKPVTSPALPGGGVLIGVTATSASNAWAVGALNYLQPKARTLVLRWNGRTWK